MAQRTAVVRTAPNNPVFDLPVIVAIEEGLFHAAGLCTVQMLESAVGPDHVRIEAGALPQARWAAHRNGSIR